MEKIMLLFVTILDTAIFSSLLSASSLSFGEGLGRGRKIRTMQNKYFAVLPKGAKLC